MEYSDSLQSFTDTSPSVVFGGFYNNKWFADAWLPEIESCNKTKSTALYELHPIVIVYMLCLQ